MSILIGIVLLGTGAAAGPLAWRWLDNPLERIVVAVLGLLSVGCGIGKLASAGPALQDVAAAWLSVLALACSLTLLLCLHERSVSTRINKERESTRHMPRTAPTPLIFLLISGLTALFTTCAVWQICTA